jgi:amino acid transporter
MAVVYTKFSGMMPRSGVDHVWSSRILGSAYGTIQFVFVFAVFIVTALDLALVFFPTIGVSQLFFIAGAVKDNAGLISDATCTGSLLWDSRSR